jgi:hypothetical protein
MPNFCGFVMRARGEHSQLFSLQCLLERGRGGFSDDGNIIVEFERLFPEDVVGRNDTGHPRMVPDLHHTFLWIHDPGEPPIAKISDGTLELYGESKWHPPFRFMAKVSILYPGLDFFLRGSTEHSRREIWRASKGLVWLVDDYFSDFPFEGDGEIITWVTRDSVDLDLGKYYLPADIRASG